MNILFFCRLTGGYITNHLRSHSSIRQFPDGQDVERVSRVAPVAEDVNASKDNFPIGSLNYLH
jgi:hypothetical protein